MKRSEEISIVVMIEKTSNGLECKLGTILSLDSVKVQCLFLLELLDGGVENPAGM